MAKLQTHSVIQFLKEACTPRASVFNESRNDTALDLSDFFSGKIGSDFLDENYFTDGLIQLSRLGLRRLAGHSDQGVFVLSQNMGGGKTHGMITLGLLCQNPKILKSAKNLSDNTTMQAANLVRSKSLAFQVAKTMPPSVSGALWPPNLVKKNSLPITIPPSKLPDSQPGSIFSRVRQP